MGGFKSALIFEAVTSLTTTYFFTTPSPSAPPLRGGEWTRGTEKTTPAPAGTLPGRGMDDKTEKRNVSCDTSQMLFKINLFRNKLFPDAVYITRADG